MSTALVCNFFPETFFLWLFSMTFFPVTFFFSENPSEPSFSTGTFTEATAVISNTNIDSLPERPVLPTSP